MADLSHQLERPEDLVVTALEAVHQRVGYRERRVPARAGRARQLDDAELREVLASRVRVRAYLIGRLLRSLEYDAQPIDGSTRPAKLH